MSNMMKALVKAKAEAGHLDGRGAGAGDRPQ